MSIEFAFRIIGMLVLSVVGVYWGAHYGVLAGDKPDTYAITLGLVGALIGLVLTPFITTRPARYMRRVMASVSAQTLAAGLAGLMAGLIVAALLAFPISLLPRPLGEVLPFIGVLVASYFGILIFVMRQEDIFALLRWPVAASQEKDEDESSAPASKRTILLDTSVIIDGRIADIAHTGFLAGTLLIPRFVLEELQHIADSSDSLRRQRGRRGIDVLGQLQRETIIPVRISDVDVDGVREVDNKLVILARQMRAQILTNDYNLNRVAELQGVTVLNINELANAVKSVMLPGEILNVNIIQEGRESSQGVAYLDDGTMVVIEDGRDHIHQQVDVQVTKVLQTAAGRMIFARIED